MLIPTTVEQRSIGFGDVGTLDDLSHMAGLVDRSLSSPRVVMFARSLAARSVRWPEAQALAIRNFLTRVWRFVEDPARRELLRDPDHMLREYEATGIITGDCDEAAILGAALGEAVGLGAQFVVLGFPESDNNYSHVFARLLTPAGKLVSLDVTRPAGPVPAPSRVMVVQW
jgi:transglutaminase-like putative cysteine protease